jgi:hypothetical protein
MTASISPVESVEQFGQVKQEATHCDFVGASLFLFHPLHTA